MLWFIGELYQRSLSAIVLLRTFALLFSANVNIVTRTRKMWLLVFFWRVVAVGGGSTRRVKCDGMRAALINCSAAAAAPGKWVQLVACLAHNTEFLYGTLSRIHIQTCVPGIQFQWIRSGWMCDRNVNKSSMRRTWTRTFTMSRTVFRFILFPLLWAAFHQPPTPPHHSAHIIIHNHPPAEAAI